MRKSRYGLRALGLCLLTAVGLMAATATSAQAVPDWLVLQVTPPENQLIVQPIILESEADTMMSISGKLLGMSVTILCKSTILKSGLLEEEGKVSGTYVFSECETLLNGKAAKACEVKVPIEVKFKGQAFSHNKAGYVLMTPASGKTFAVIKLGEECAVGEKVELTGTYVEEWCDNIEEYLLRHLALEADPALFATGEHISALKLGTSAATIDGSIWKKVSSDNKWKYMP